MTYSQINFQSDMDKVPLYPEIANQIDSIYSDFDFQFRFWIDGPLLRINKKRVFIMTLKSNNWTCFLYKFTYKRRDSYFKIKPDIRINNCDSVWNYFMQNHILQLPTMESLQIKINELMRSRDSRFVIADGLTYSIEFIEKDKYKRLDYHCPITFNKEFPEIHELSDISNIVKLIFTISKIKYKPC